MRIGLLTDIHEHIEFAAAAIEDLQQLGVDEIICLGDFCQMEENIDAMCQLLLDKHVRSVWGNHDFGLCQDVRQANSKNYSSTVQRFATQVRGRIQIDRFLFCHVEPWLNSNNLQDLWYYEGEPDTDCKRQRIFDDSGWDIAFAGHYHRWLAYREHEQVNWQGDTVLDLSSGRYFVVIHACMHGHYAVFDTRTRQLSPKTVSTVAGEGNGAVA